VGRKLAAGSESAFRLELGCLLLLTPVAVWIGETAVEVFLLLGSIVFLMIVELLNTTLEAVGDRVELEFHELSKQAKDLGAAAVFLGICLVTLTWLVILFD
jgi:diacylglycerol kinase (ATP)